MRLLLIFCALVGLGCGSSEPRAARPPNMILIMTDDQGWAQLGSHGDDVLKTPNLDRLAGESVEFTRFYVSPVCAPTRASLMTGRYNYRTGVVDTYLGRAQMAPDEVTSAELLGQAGYRTGIFGKWHLGDNYPMRAMDQGFGESVVHRGGGIGQPSDPPGSDYFDPILFHNGEQKQYEGYCTDVYFDEAIRFISESDDRPFFIYLPTNAPHSPYLVPDSYREPYAALGLDDKDARIYGMISNIDDNVGRLTAKLENLNIAQDTVLIFMTDNGPTTRRFDGGLRNQKASVYEGGIRVPFFYRWPARFGPNKVDTIAAHIDVMPTLLDAAGIEPPANLRLDGRSLSPLLDGEKPASWPDRTLFIQSHRGDAPELYRAFAAVEQRWKLLQPLSFREAAPPDAAVELYDIEADPAEADNIADRHPDVVERLKQRYVEWFADVGASRGYDPLPIYVGADEQPVVTLTRQDWRAVGDDNWGAGGMGEWHVDVREAGVYDFQVDFKLDDADSVELKVGDTETQAAAGNKRSVSFEGMQLPAGLSVVRARVRAGPVSEGAWFVTVRKQ